LTVVTQGKLGRVKEAIVIGIIAWWCSLLLLIFFWWYSMIPILLVVLVELEPEQTLSIVHSHDAVFELGSKQARDIDLYKKEREYKQ
jgi:hypothetical protein